MKTIRRILFGVGFVILTGGLLAQQETLSLSSISLAPATDTKAMLDILSQITPTPFDSLPRNSHNQVPFVGFWSIQHPNWPPLPGNIYGLDVWPLGDGVFVLDDRQVDYAALQAEADLEAAATLSSTPRMRMMMSRLSTAYAYGNPVYLTNLVLTSTSGMTAVFDIAGGTNNVPYDILTATNIALPVANWSWLGIGYTANHYTFPSQPADMGFYILAKPSKTMTVAWGEDNYGQSDVPSSLTNAVMISGSLTHTLALLADGTLKSWGDDTPTNLTGVTMIGSGLNHDVALLTNGTVKVWGDNTFGELNMPYPITNGVVVSAQGLNSLVLTSNGTVVAWGDNTYGVTNVPADLTNAVAIACGGEHNLAVRANGTVAAWGDNSSGECNVPAGLSNVWDVAAGWVHSVALKKDGTVICWGDNTFGQTNVPAGLSNVVAIAAGGYVTGTRGYTLALKKDGTVVLWGKNTINPLPVGLSNVIAIGGGSDLGLAIRTGPPTPVITLMPTDQYQIAGGAVTFTAKGQGLYGVTYQWQTNSVNLPGATNGTLTLTNVQMAQQGNYDMVVTDNGGMGSIVSSNASFTLVTSPVIVSQSQPTNVVCIYGNYLGFFVTASAPGMNNGFPLSYQWQFNGTNISAATNNFYSLFANDNSGGTYSMIVSNAAGSVTAVWSVTVTNAINVTNDLLLIYNTNSPDSTFVKDYYLAHRPNVGGANVLGIGCPGIFITNISTGSYYYGISNATAYESITAANFTNQVLAPVQAWLTNNPAKRPQYVILFLDVPSRTDDSATTAANYPFYTGVGNSSVSYLLATSFSGWQPFITHLNMNGTNDCIAYINKLASLGTLFASNSPILSASAGGYGNTNYALDNVRKGNGYPFENYTGSGASVSSATNALIASGVVTNAIIYNDGVETITTVVTNGMTNTVYFYPPHLTNAPNVAGYVCWGLHSALGANYAINASVKWTGNSGWWIIETFESYNGRRYQADFGTFIKWFSSNAFGGTNYANTPIGAVSHTDEPFLGGVNDSSIYFGSWAAGKNFAICAWNSKPSFAPRFQAVGDPFVTK